jgi:hypothetical protein
MFDRPPAISLKASGRLSGVRSAIQALTRSMSMPSIFPGSFTSASRAVANA